MQGVKRLLIFLIVCGTIWFVHSINPTFDTHMDMIYAELDGASAESPPQIKWDDLLYTDLFFVSFTKSAEKHTMVSVGLCNFVKVVDDEWAQKNVKVEEDPFR